MERESAAFQQKLQDLRNDIDRIDDQLLDLLNQRARCAQQLGQLKRQFGEAGRFRRPEREAQVLTRLLDRNRGPLLAEHVDNCFREVMSACLSLEGDGPPPNSL